MNDSHEELASPGKLGAETPSGNGLISAQGPAEERPASPGQNTVLVAECTITVIEAQRIESETQLGSGGYAALEAAFRNHHHTNAAQRRGPYEHYRLVYRYGYDLGTDTRYRAADWPMVEQAARPRWEERNRGTWEQFKETIRYAWDTARGWRGDDC
jgi:hypothetical protein